MPANARRLAVPLLATIALTIAAAPAAAAGTKEVTAAESAATAYLKTQQQSDGSFAGFGGEWALSALAAAGTAPANVLLPGGTDARTYYRNLIGDSATWPGAGAPVQDYETAALAAYASGIDPARVSASQNLLAQIVAGANTSHPGYYGELSALDATIFGLISLADTPTTKGEQRVPQALLEESVAAVRANQHSDGGWGFTRAEGSKELLESPGEAETTGAAIAALCSAGVKASDPAIVSARHFLTAELAAESSGSGAFATEFGPNTDSNAWAVQGLNACGISPQSNEFTTSKGKTPIDFLLSQQLAGGGFVYEPGETEANLYSSQDALRALAGAGFTVAPPKPHKAPQWVAEKAFTPGTRTSLALIINSGKGGLGVCSVSIDPSSTKVTLAQVLEAAESSATPAGCVSSFAPTSGSKPITAINGQPSPPAADWKVSLDGAGPKTAKRATKVAAGDVISLQLG